MMRIFIIACGVIPAAGLQLSAAIVGADVDQHPTPPIAANGAQEDVNSDCTDVHFCLGASIQYR